MDDFSFELFSEGNIPYHRKDTGSFLCENISKMAAPSGANSGGYLVDNVSIAVWKKLDTI